MLCRFEIRGKIIFARPGSFTMIDGQPHKVCRYCGEMTEFEFLRMRRHRVDNSCRQCVNDRIYTATRRRIAKYINGILYLSCSSCKILHDEGAFNYSKRDAYGRQGACREAMKQYLISWHRVNDKHTERIRSNSNHVWRKKKK